MVVYPSRECDFEVAMYNPDGSAMGMCGNGIRCVARFVKMEGLVSPQASQLVFRVDGSRRVVCELKGEGDGRTVRVDMGEPSFAPETVPVQASQEVIGQKLQIGSECFEITCLSMGNPHCVVFVDDVAGLELERLGPKFESHPLFPARVNTEFVQVTASQALRVRVWERGAGATLACGTGACACVVAATRNDLCDGRAIVELPGGALEVVWERDTNRVFMTGPANEVFKGVMCR